MQARNDPLKIAMTVLILIMASPLQVLFGAGGSPVLAGVFPAGGQIGRQVELNLSGSGLEGVGALRSNVAGATSERVGPNRFRLVIPETTVPGFYDLWAIGESGVSAVRGFMVGARRELIEAQTPGSIDRAMAVGLDVTINGRIEKAGEADFFRFEAKSGQRVIMECFAERIDSPLRAVLELFDKSGTRLAVNRGYFGIDPVIDFKVSNDGTYFVKLQDLTMTGSADHIYRLDLDTGPRVVYTMPSVVQKGKPSRVALYGWNLNSAGGARSNGNGRGFDRVEMEIPGHVVEESGMMPVRMNLEQASMEGFAYHYPKSHSSIFMGLTDIPVVVDGPDSHGPGQAQGIKIPSEICGQLVAGDERDWYWFEASRGEVFYFEGLAGRIQSSMDLRVAVFDAKGDRELARIGDDVSGVRNVVESGNSDPIGRWRAPQDGRYLVSVQNRVGGILSDSRRIYRLSVRREEPDFELLAVPRGSDSSGLNLVRGGRCAVDVIAFRKCGFSGGIRIFANRLPNGVEFPDIWIGPGVNEVVGVVSGEELLVGGLSGLELNGESEGIGRRRVRNGTKVRSGGPALGGRLVSAIPLSVVGDAALSIRADAHEELNHQLYGRLKVRHSPGGVVDVAVRIDRREMAHQSPVKLIGAGLPAGIENQNAIIPSGSSKGYLSFFLPPTLPLGLYSLLIQAETSVVGADPKKPETVVVLSKPVTIEVEPSAFQVGVDPFAVKQVKRGETIQVAYKSERRNGFIGKMHTEIAMPGRITDVTGLRGRGETFVGQTEKGSLQIIVNDDAPLGRIPFLRLLTVGVVEDEPIYQGSVFLNLEVVK